MADTKDEIDLAAVARLPAEHRLAVNTALKATLERELVRVGGAAGTAAGVNAAEHTRESGPLHGSQHTKGSAALDHGLLERLHGMNEREFTEFSARLASIRAKPGQ